MGGGEASLSTNPRDLSSVCCSVVLDQGWSVPGLRRPGPFGSGRNPGTMASQRQQVLGLLSLSPLSGGSFQLAVWHTAKSTCLSIPSNEKLMNLTSLCWKKDVHLLLLIYKYFEEIMFIFD